MTAPNQAFLAQSQDLPAASLTFGALASVVTASAQVIPPGGGAAASSTTGATGVNVTRSITLTRLRVRFVGDAANVGGQTLSFQVLKNGVAHASAVIAGLATTAGTKTSSVDFAATPLNVVDGDLVQVTVTPSALLTAVVTSMDVSVG